MAARFGLCAAAVAAMVSPACSRSSIGHAAGSAAAPNAPVATLALAYDQPAIAGTLAHATAAGLPAGQTVDLERGTVTGG